MSLGLCWAQWQALVDFRQNFSTMDFGWPLKFAVFYLAALTAYRLLMAWFCSNTHSLLLAVQMRASHSGRLVALYPATPFGQDLLWQAAFAVALWLAAAVGMVWIVPREPPPASPMPLRIDRH